MAGHNKNQPLLNEDENSEDENNLLDTDEVAFAKHDEEPFLKDLDTHVVHDKYNIAYMVFYLLGINTLIPWNFFITADAYWMYKFRDIKKNETEYHFINYVYHKRSDLQASYTSYITVASAIPNTLFTIISIFISRKVSLTTRIIASQCIILIVFIATTTLVKVNTDKWQHLFLTITLGSVAIVNAAAAIFCGSLMGIVGKFSSKYITAMIAGQALGGIFSATSAILSLYIGASPVTSGLFYFSIGDIFIFLSLIAYMVLERQVFFRHHMIIKPKDPTVEELTINTNVTFSEDQVSYLRIFKRIWAYGLSIFLVFMITVVVYPSIAVLVESKGKGHGHPWNDIYFGPVVVYLIFNCGDYAGRILSGFIKWPRSNPLILFTLCVLRFLFIPAFLICNAQPRHHLPVYIHEDIYFILLIVSFAISNGYLCNITLMIVPTVVEPHEKEVASTMMGAFLSLGFTIGSPFSLLIIKLL